MHPSPSSDPIPALESVRGFGEGEFTYAPSSLQAPLTLPVFRFAPSPNGFLHLGHAYSALLNEAFAARLSGRLLLRIEDIDITRCRPEFIAACEEDLVWLGLKFERPVRRQSEHLGDYSRAFSQASLKNVAYRCFCSRKDLAEGARARQNGGASPLPRDPDGVPLYPGTCKSLSDATIESRLLAGDPHTWRINMARACQGLTQPLSYVAIDFDGTQVTHVVDPRRWGDAVIVRRDIPTSYHLSVAVDDNLQGVTHVVRGQDLEAATDLHVLLQRLLGFATPFYHHHRLIRDARGDKLAKSRMSEPLRDLRARGVSPAEVRRRLRMTTLSNAQDGQPEQR